MFNYLTCSLFPIPSLSSPPLPQTWQFNHPVCLVQGIEMIWTPSPEEDERSLPQQHLMESLWLACGAAGIKASLLSLV